MSNAVFLRPDENGNWGKVGTDAAGSMSELLTFQSGAIAVGAGTVQDVSGYTSVSLRVVISGTASVVFEASVDGTNYTAMNGTRTDGSVVSTITTTNDIRLNIAGYKLFRARISAYTSGTVDVSGYLTTQTANIQNAVCTTFGSSDTNSSTQIIQGVGAYNLLYDGSNWIRQRSVTALNDASGTGLNATGLYGYNGASWDRVRTVSAGDGVTTGLLAQGGYVWDSAGSVWNRIRSANGVADAADGTRFSATSLTGFNGATWDRFRVGKVYKYIEYLNLPTATSTTVWTPAAGKKFRLMGIVVTTSASVHLHMRDATTVFHTVRPLATGQSFDFGNGYLSAAANNVLEVRNDSGTTTNVWVTAWGTEE